MTLRATVYLDPEVDSAIIAELERMSFRRRAGRLVQLLRVGAETSIRQRDGTLRGGLVRCRVAQVHSVARMRIGIRLSGQADAAVMQLLAESSNRRSERLRQLAQCGLEREAFWTSNGLQAPQVPLAAPVQPLTSLPVATTSSQTRVTRNPAAGDTANSALRPNPYLLMAGFGSLSKPAPSRPSR